MPCCTVYNIIFDELYRYIYIEYIIYIILYIYIYMYYIYIILYICIIYIYYTIHSRNAPKALETHPNPQFCLAFKGQIGQALAVSDAAAEGKAPAVSAEGQQLWRRNLPILYNYGYIHYTSLYW